MRTWVQVMSNVKSKIPKCLIEPWMDANIRNTEFGRAFARRVRYEIDIPRGVIDKSIHEAKVKNGLHWIDPDKDSYQPVDQKKFEEIEAIEWTSESCASERPGCHHVHG